MRQILLRGTKDPFDITSQEQALGDRLIGGNSGNLIFLESAYKLLGTHDTEITVDRFNPERLGADLINERFEAYVIPLANAFRPAFQSSLKRYTRVIERLKIPVVVLGVGFQGPLPYGSGTTLDVDDTARAFVKAVLDRSGSIGVRGEYTQDYLQKLGFRDVEVIGCPSMFLDGDRFTVTKRTPSLERDARLGFTVTPYVTAMGPIITSHLERYPNLEYIAQDKVAMGLMLYGDGAREPGPLPLHPSHPLIRDGRARLFIDPWPWLAHMREMDFVFGTRIHGSIVTLLAGTPAYVFAHDTRTLELARYFEIPHRLMTDVPSTIDAAELYAEADYGPLVAGHAARFRTYIDYVERHGLRHVFQPGEDPAAFDRRIASIEFPPPVRPRRYLRIHRMKRRARQTVRRVRKAARRRTRRT